MIKLICKPVAFSRPEPNNTRIVLRTESFNTNDPTHPIPANITLDFKDVEFDANTMDALLSGSAVDVYLGEQPTPNFKPNTSTVRGEPLFGDELQCASYGVQVKLKRNKELPNPNCYDVYYGKTNVGYIRLPFHSLLWGCAVVVQGSGLTAKFTAESVEDAQAKFCKKLAEILEVEA